METLDKIVSYIEGLDKRQFRFHALGFFTGIVFVAGSLLYYIANSKTELIHRLQALNKMAVKGCQIIDTNRQLVKDEQHLKLVLEQKRGFSIQAFFEQACREQNLTAEPGWAPRSDHISDIFDEIILTANFKNITTEKLVKFLDALNKEEIVYLKDLQIKNSANKTIAISVTIATKCYKSSLE